MLLKDDDGELDWQLQFCGVLDCYGCHRVAEAEKSFVLKQAASSISVNRYNFM
jgi:hypothetical protein